MKYTNRYVEVDIMYEVFDLQNKLVVANEWIPCRLNLKQSKTVCRRIEVRAEPLRDELSFVYDFDIDASNIVWKPVSLGDRKNAFCFFWAYGGRICELFLSFEDKSTFDSYVAYLENLMFCLSKDLIVTEEEQDGPTYPYSYEYPIPNYLVYAARVIAEALENADDEDDVAPDADKKSHPMSTLSNLFSKKKAKKRNSAKKSHTVQTREHQSEKCDTKSAVGNFLKKKKRSIRNIFSRRISCEMQNLEPDHKLKESSSQLSPAPVKSRIEPYTFEEEAALRVIQDSTVACVLSICSPDSSLSHMNLLDANGLIHNNSNGSFNEADFDLLEYNIDDQNKDNSMLSDWSLSSFVTAKDDCVDNVGLVRFDSGRTPIRRKLSSGYRSGSECSIERDDEQHSKYSTCSETNLDDEASSVSSDTATASSKSSGPPNWHHNQSEEISLPETDGITSRSNISTSVLPVEDECVQNWICTPFRNEKIGTNQLEALATNASNDCSSTSQQFKRLTLKAQLHKKYTKAKSTSISKNASYRISRIRRMTMSFLSASSQALSMFV